MLATNRLRLVAMHVAGEIAPASVPSSLYDIGADGVPRVLPSVGGICLNVRVGDNAFAPLGDHIEPAVSVRAKDDRANVGFCVLACVGNRATVLSGDAKGETGVVTGKHGGIEHAMVDFNERVMARMTIGDKIGIHAVGLGLELDDPAMLRFSIAIRTSLSGSALCGATVLCTSESPRSSRHASGVPG